MKILDKLRVPIIQGGMGVGISMGNLAGHVAYEGGMGVISTADIGFREVDFHQNTEEANKRALRAEIKKAREISRGRGMIAINAMVVTNNFKEMVKTACEAGIDAIISGAGLPLDLPEIVKGFNVLIAPIVSSGKAAATLLKKWQLNYQRKADFIVVEGHEAGGHLGFKPEELKEGTAKPLLEILKDVMEKAPGIPVFCGGSIFDAGDVKEALEAGATGVQVATRFIATEECDATQGFKDVILAAKDENIQVFKSPVGMPGRGVRTPLIEKVAAGERVPPVKCLNCIRTCNPKNTPYCITEALISAYYGDVEKGLFFCGGNGGKINEMTTVKKVMAELSAPWE